MQPRQPRPLHPFVHEFKFVNPVTGHRYTLREESILFRAYSADIKTPADFFHVVKAKQKQPRYIYVPFSRSSEITMRDEEAKEEDKVRLKPQKAHFQLIQTGHVLVVDNDKGRNAHLMGNSKAGIKLISYRRDSWTCDFKYTSQFLSDEQRAKILHEKYIAPKYRDYDSGEVTLHDYSFAKRIKRNVLDASYKRYFFILTNPAYAHKVKLDVFDAQGLFDVKKLEKYFSENNFYAPYEHIQTFKHIDDTNFKIFANKLTIDEEYETQNPGDPKGRRWIDFGKIPDVMRIQLLNKVRSKSM